MSTPYCFTERPRELFTEAAARGWLAAIRDFPRLKTWEECEAAAQRVPDDLRPDVCCIGAGDEYSYRLLVVTAWVNSYRSFGQVGERPIALMVATIKALPEGEALALVRAGFAGEDAQAALDEGYARFQDFHQARAGQ